MIATFIGSFAAWSLMAPIARAVVAPGIVSVDSNVRTVQKLEGGIVGSINVREGSEVSTGDVVLRLQNTIPASVMIAVQARLFELEALEARLFAERDGAEAITFPENLRMKVGDRAAQDAMRGQEEIFASRRELLRERLIVLDQTRFGIESEITGLEGRIASAERQLDIINEELGTVADLVERQLAERSRLLALRRELASLEGSIAEHRAAIGTATQRIEEVTLKMAELRANRTIGGVVSPGEDLLEIMPSGDKLMVQATIDRLDIDQVSVGQPATVWLSALNRRTQTGIDGEVGTICAYQPGGFAEPSRGIAPSQ